MVGICRFKEAVIAFYDMRVIKETVLMNQELMTIYH